jgi:hypothetical protein
MEKINWAEHVRNEEVLLTVITVRLLLFARSVCLKQYSQGFKLGVELTSRMINTLDKAE